MPAAMLGAEVTERSKTLAVPAGEREREFRQPKYSVVCAKATA